LLVVIAIIGVLVGLLLPAVQAAREAARKMQCSNNLKQIGIAVHNFHDTRNGLPPSCLFNLKPSFWALIYPYIEQQPLYDLLESVPLNLTAAGKPPLVLDGVSTTNTGGWFTNALTKDQQNAFGAVPIYKCPSRRSGTKICLLSSNVNGNGPRGDYGIVSILDSVTNASGGYVSNLNGGWGAVISMYGNATKNYFIEHNVGPFEVSNLTFNVPATASLTNPLGGNNDDAKYAVHWDLRSTMARFQDGTSNQILVGEKFIPTDIVDKQPTILAEVHWDGSVISGHTNAFTMNIGHAVHPAYACIKRSPNDIDPSDYHDATGAVTFSHVQAVFGGIHPGIATFVLGDGSVRSFSSSMNWETLYFYARVNDGNVIAEP
jgi:type II secretory pathway pseudopilin PulG